MIVDRDSVIGDRSRLLRNQQLADLEMENIFALALTCYLPVNYSEL